MQGSALVVEGPGPPPGCGGEAGPAGGSSSEQGAGLVGQRLPRLRKALIIPVQIIGNKS